MASHDQRPRRPLLSRLKDLGRGLPRSAPWGSAASPRRGDGLLSQRRTRQTDEAWGRLRDRETPREVRPWRHALTAAGAHGVGRAVRTSRGGRGGSPCVQRRGRVWCGRARSRGRPRSTPSPPGGARVPSHGATQVAHTQTVAPGSGGREPRARHQQGREGDLPEAPLLDVRTAVSSQGRHKVVPLCLSPTLPS